MDAYINELLNRKAYSAFHKKFENGIDALVRIEEQKGFPDLGELFVDGVIDLEDILKIRDQLHGKLFRYWVKNTKGDEDIMRQEIMNSVDDVLSSKLLTPLRFAVSNMVGLAGFIPGVALSAVDSFILDKVLKGWHPNFFLDEKLKKLIDDSLAAKEKEYRNKRRNELFKGVGRYRTSSGHLRQNLRRQGFARFPGLGVCMMFVG